jgi:tRNA-dihydrouridine synthase
MLPVFYYSSIERPIVAQIFGVEVESFYKAAVLVCAMGFDGVDINMGCPAKKVAKKGSGAGLIKTPELATKIVEAVKRGVADFANGISLEEAGVHENLIEAVKELKKSGKIGGRKLGGRGVGDRKLDTREVGDRALIPVSVKTRIGYEKAITEKWIGQLVETGVDAISLHGRTLKQMYSGEADWEEIGKAAKVCREAGVLLIGNGDVKSMADGREKIEKYGVDGVMVGRAVMGNPWFFNDGNGSENCGVTPLAEVTLKERISVLIEHVKVFGKIFGEKKAFCEIRKHLCCYLKGFDGAKEKRMEVMGAENEKDVIKMLKKVPLKKDCFL